VVGHGVADPDRPVRLTRRTVASVAVGYLILLMFVAGSLWALEKRADRRIVVARQTAEHQIVVAREKAERQLRGSLINACERVNVLRTQVNTLELIAYAAWTDAVIRERKLAKMADGEVHRASARRLNRARNKIKITDLTNCPKSVREGAKFVAPKPRKITKADLRDYG
jgi:hypothetical protein